MKIVLIRPYFCPMNFQNQIISWYEIHKRDLPWRNTTDAYVIWLSEIILQQTRVEQGLPYFNKFLAQYPTIADFAGATEAQILRLWQGLGYYSRGRNMLFTAQKINSLHNGIFPIQYDELIKLKGIGEYTAAAISSFSSGEVKAVLDGNVFRVLSRYFGIDTPINSTAGKKEFSMLAQNLVREQDAALYNQAIMEFGALQCKPKSPNCPVCPLQTSCYARQNNLVNDLPVKLKRGLKKERHFNYFICAEDERILVHHRMPGDIWQHLYDFPLIETNEAANLSDSHFLTELKNNFGENVIVSPGVKMKHILTHQIIYVQFFDLDNYIINFNHNTNIKWVAWSDLDVLPQPKVITSYLNSHLTK